MLYAASFHPSAAVVVFNGDFAIWACWVIDERFSPFTCSLFYETCFKHQQGIIAFLGLVILHEVFALNYSIQMCRQVAQNKQVLQDHVSYRSCKDEN